MNIFVGVIVGLVVLMILVVLHEFGHFLMARRNGVRVLEFGIGFPPRAIAWIKDPEIHKWRKLKKSEWDKAGIMKTVLEQKEETENDKSKVAEAKTSKNASIKALAGKEKLIADGLVFSINWLPIGGFCQMDGESAEDAQPGTFGHASFWKKTKILFGGVAMNWLTAFVIFTVLAWAGMPQFLDNQFTVADDTRVVTEPVLITEVIAETPADQAGFQVGDRIISIDGNAVRYGRDITEYNNAHTGEEVVYKVLRTVDCRTSQNELCRVAGVAENGEAPILEAEEEIKVRLNSADSEYLLGVAMESSQTLTYSTWSAPVVGAGLTLQITGETFKGLGELVWNLVSGTGRLFSFDSAVRESGQEAISSVGDSVSGPIGIIGVLFPSYTAMGPANLAFLAALISVSLACMNVLPIPALDGGRWLLIAIYKLRRKKLTKETEQRIVSRAMAVLLVLMVAIAILDVTRFF